MTTPEEARFPPVCRECQYHHQHTPGAREWCSSPNLEALDLIQYVRAAPSECGEEGKWFKPKENENAD
jgi:hypothetical protein